MQFEILFVDTINCCAMLFDMMYLYVSTECGSTAFVDILLKLKGIFIVNNRIKNNPV